MARVLDILKEPEHPCSYLPDRSASLRHRIMLDVSREETEALLARGWRRFGPDYFRPDCPDCVACEPSRIAIADFVPSRSQRRAWQHARTLRREWGPPRVDAARLQLYARWHAHRERARGWESSELSEHSYRVQFAFPHPAARELAFYDGDSLLGVSLCDETPEALSAIYFFFDPAHARLSLGVGNVLSLIELGQAMGKRHLYLGFTVLDCASLRYKANFQPREVLQGAPHDDQTPVWRRAEPRPAGAAPSTVPALALPDQRRNE